MGDGGAFGALDRIGRRRRSVEEVEAAGAKGSGVEFEDAGGAEAVQGAAVADVVEEEVAVILAAAGASDGLHRRGRIEGKPLNGRVLGVLGSSN